MARRSPAHGALRLCSAGGLKALRTFDICGAFVMLFYGLSLRYAWVYAGCGYSAARPGMRINFQASLERIPILVHEKIRD